jgi:S1-C subfamily serine protease
MFYRYLHITFLAATLLSFFIKPEELYCITPKSNYGIDSTRVNSSPAYQSNPNLNFQDFISGVNSIYVITPEELSPKLFNDDLFLSKYRNLITTYLHSIGIINVAISSMEYDSLDSLVSLTQTAVFKLNLDFTKNYISKVIFSFTSCNKDEFRFEKNVDYYIDAGWDKVLSGFLKSIYSQVVTFNKNKSYKLRSTFTAWNESKITDYLDNSTDRLEGIYEKYASDTQFKIAVVKNKGNYEIIYLAGAKNKFDWKEGDLKGIIRETAIKNFYKVDWLLADKSMVPEVYLSTAEENFLKFDFIDPKINSSSKYVKMYPSYSQGKTITPSAFATSGTGFAISKNGLIATSYHVIENSNSIVVQFNDNNGAHNYPAEVLIEDKTNDLAVLAIKDKSFKTFDEIPYMVSGEESSIGKDVFTLGFPLIETMGKSIKLNNGIISSHSGFLDDDKFYQLTMPINSGNSGGPLFDKTGRLIGIITGKHSGAENVTYALKSVYLKKLIEKMPDLKIRSEGNSLIHKSFTDLIQSVQKFICVIEVK